MKFCLQNGSFLMSVVKSTQQAKFYWLIAACVLVGILEFLSLNGIRLPNSIEIPFYLLMIIGIGHTTLWHGLIALFTLNFKSIQALMVIAVIGAFYLGRYEEAAVVIVLYTLAEKLEDYGIEKSHSALRTLVEKMPKKGQLKDGRLIPISDIKTDEIIILKPGDMIPLDGIILKGQAFIDESTITGEPVPKDKTLGDSIFAGTLNVNGYLEIKVTKSAKDSTFEKIKQLTFEATESKATTQRFIETFSQYYTPLVIGLAFFLTLIPPLFFHQPFDPWLLRGLSLIVIACPCALVISTPVSIYSAIGNASKQGALIKGGRYVEEMGKIKAIGLDKTRTLTYGKPFISDIIPYGKVSKKHLIECVAGIEMLTSHPLAQSIVEEAKNSQFIPHQMRNFQNVMGKGAKADCLICEDSHRCVGKLSFILEEHPVPNEVIDTIDKLQNQGKTVIVISSHKQVEGLIALMDRIKPESAKLIEGLHQLDIVPVMLTGDHLNAATVVAKELGIKEIRADLLPEDKANAIKKLIKQYGAVGMVGDGINDAPALALSTVGISMGSLGSDMAIEAASIIILHDRLDSIPFLISLGKHTLNVIKFNVALAISIKLIFISLALFGMSNLALAIFADVGVTLIVILISLQLLNWKKY